MPFDYQSLANKAAEVAPDMNEAEVFEGGDFEPPKAGVVRLRLIDYIELGKHQEEYDGKPKTVEKVWLNFELSGPNYPPREVEGKLVPMTKGFEVSKSLTDKSKFYKIFCSMNPDKKATHFAQLLAQSFLGTIYHVEKEKNGKKVVYANLYNQNGYSIRPNIYEDPETNEKRVIEAEPLRSPIRVFIWDMADKSQWDSIFIDGKTKDRTDDKGVVTHPGRSKNRFQERIKAALNYIGSPAAELGLAGVFDEVEKPARTEENVQASVEAKVQAKTGAAADPLANI